MIYMGIVFCNSFACDRVAKGPIRAAHEENYDYGL